MIFYHKGNLEYLRSIVTHELTTLINTIIAYDLIIIAEKAENTERTLTMFLDFRFSRFRGSLLFTLWSKIMR
jgi:hypothetical protein